MSVTEDNYNYYPTKFVDQDGSNGLVPGEQRRDSDDISGLVSIRKTGSKDQSVKKCLSIRNEIK